MWRNFWSQNWFLHVAVEENISFFWRTIHCQCPTSEKCMENEQKVPVLNWKKNCDHMKTLVCYMYYTCIPFLTGLYVENIYQWLLQLKNNCLNIYPVSFETGPDVKKLCALSQILKDSSITINRSILTSYDTENFQNECRSVLEQLQERGLFSLARKVAELAELPVDSVVVREV